MDKAEGRTEHVLTCHQSLYLVFLVDFPQAVHLGTFHLPCPAAQLLLVVLLVEYLDDADTQEIFNLPLPVSKCLQPFLPHGPVVLHPHLFALYIFLAAAPVHPLFAPKSNQWISVGSDACPAL